MVDAVAVHPPTLADFQTRDPLVAQEFLDSAYGAKLRMTTMKQLWDEATPFSHKRIDIGPVAVEDVLVPGELRASPDPLNKLLVCSTIVGHIDTGCHGLTGQAGPGHVTLCAQPDLPLRAHLVDFRAKTAVIDSALVSSVAGCPRTTCDRSGSPGSSR